MRTTCSVVRYGRSRKVPCTSGPARHRGRVRVKSAQDLACRKRAISLAYGVAIGRTGAAPGSATTDSGTHSASFL